MRIALVLNHLVTAPTIEKHEVNVKRRERHSRIISDTIQASGHDVCYFEDDAELKNNLLSFKPDLVFLQTFRADPGASVLKIQKLLEELKLPYTGSPPAACRIAQNKFLAKEKFRQAGLPTPGYVLIHQGEDLKHKPENLHYPLFIKPVYGGCSMGINPKNPVYSDQKFEFVLSETLSRSKQPALAEEFIQGREFTVGVLGNEPPTALPVIEFIDLADEETHILFRQFDAKTDTEVHERISCPADQKEGERDLIQRLAVSAFRAIGCMDYARVDIRCDCGNNPYVLEVNVHPSLLPTSSLPIMAAKAGIGYPQLMNHIFQSALSRSKDIFE